MENFFKNLEKKRFDEPVLLWGYKLAHLIGEG
jgi:hypothetical protein